MPENAENDQPNPATAGQAPHGQPPRSPDAQDAALYRRRWFKLFYLWQNIHWVFLIFVTGGSAAVASAAVKDWSGKEQLALAVAVAGAIYTALNPGQRAEAYREAWVGLNTAIMRGDPPEDIVEAYGKGEEIIGRRPTPTKS